jgi:phospholipid/cholesterol/gamma-HCH transport system ATP-binding protein
MLHAGQDPLARGRGHMDGADDPYLTQFITGAPEGPIETLR